MNIKDFLLARIAEDEAVAREEDDDYADTTLLPTYDSEHQANWNTARVLDECAAKRALIELAGEVGRVDEVAAGEGASDGQLENALFRTLAMPYAGHRNYQKEWAL